MNRFLKISLQICVLSLLLNAAGCENPPIVQSGAAPSPAASPTPSPAPSPGPAGSLGLWPKDTRIIVNAPAYRMDVFENGRLIKSYQIGIGYPEYPLPSGLRMAETIIFNPAWTPPDEPWVTDSDKFRPGEKIEPGSGLNPLGPIKIPIQAPSLIHGGKRPAQVGGFASHGCVGLTDAQVKDFAKILARLGGAELTDADLVRYESNRAKSETLKLNRPVPVELRYETLVVENGQLRIYRDVYEYGTNTPENLGATFAAYGVSMDRLSDEERDRIEAALIQMSLDPRGVPIEATTAEEKENRRQDRIDRGRVTRTVKGPTEEAIGIAALAGKGNPAPVALDTGDR